MRDEPLFSSYLFIRLGQGSAAQNWAPIRSTKGVSRLVSFGIEPAKVDDRLISVLHAQSAIAHAEPEPLFKSGERVIITDGAFNRLEAIYQMADGDQQSLVLIELIGRSVSMRVMPSSLQKAS